LKFEEAPDYKYLKKLLQKVIKKNYPDIKRMKDIDIINNNCENYREVKPPKMDSIKNTDILIDVS